MTSSSQPLCQGCNSTPTQGAALCVPCTRKLADALAHCSWLPRQLEVALTRQQRFQRQQEGARSTTRPLPWDERASHALVDLHSTVSAWAVLISRSSEHAGDRLSQVSTETEDVARWINRNMDTLRMMAPETVNIAYRELTGCIKRAFSSVDRPPDLVTYGVCGNEGPTGDAAQCTEYLYALPSAAEVKCRRCKMTYDVRERRKWMLEYVQGMFGTTSEVSAYLTLAGIKVSVDAVRALARRHNGIEVVGMAPSASGKAVPLYRFSDVLAAIGSRYKKPKTVRTAEK